MRRLFPFVNLAVLIVTIAINYVSSSGLLQRETVATVSARYPTLITPAPYAFSIWGLIYIALLCFTIYHLKRNPETVVTLQQVDWWFMMSCVANASWVIAWIYGHIGLSVLIMVVLVSCLIKIIVRTDMELTDPPWQVVVFVWWPFCLYLGWIVIAAAVNVAAWLVSVGWAGWGVSPGVWAFIVLMVAGMIYILLIWRRNMREAAMAGVWALVAVGVADHASYRLVSNVAFLVAGILFFNVVGHGYLNRNASPFRKRSAAL